MNDLRVAAVQFQHAPGDKAYNLSVMRRFIENAHAQQVELIVFPECCVSGYWHLRNLSREQLDELAESADDGPTACQLREWAAEFKMTIGAGFIEKSGSLKLVCDLVAETVPDECVDGRLGDQQM